LYENYGWAGPIFSQWVVGNLSTALEVLDGVQKQIDEAAGLTSRERFYSGTASAVIAGGLIANHLGLHDIEVNRVRDWAITMLKSICSQAAGEDMDEIFRWMYDNLELWSKDPAKQDEAILAIRKGLVNHTMCSDPEINLSATLIELTQL
jgi:hypothetical protein